MAGLSLGLVWSFWHVLVDLRYNSSSMGIAWPLEFAIVYVATLTPYRILMAWVYSNTQSLLLAVLMHASYTGWLLVLFPATSLTQGLLWQSLFAVMLWWWRQCCYDYPRFASRVMTLRETISSMRLGEGKVAFMFRTVPGASRSAAFILMAIKAAHTLVWAFFAACIFMIWVFAWQAHYSYAALAIGVVMVEVVVLIMNGLRCPLTLVAARYTDDQRANFDIYLPEWLARNNTLIFGAVYVAGIIFTLAKWACLSA